MYKLCNYTIHEQNKKYCTFTRYQNILFGVPWINVVKLI